MANPGEEVGSAATPSDDPGKTPAPMPQGATGADSGGRAAGTDAAAPSKKAASPSGSLNQLKPLVPRKQTMMGLGAARPPGTLPTPLSGISPMQRPPVSKAPSVTPAAPAEEKAPAAPEPVADAKPAPAPPRAPTVAAKAAAPAPPKPADAASKAAVAPAKSEVKPAPAAKPEEKLEAKGATVGAAADSEELEVTTDLSDESSDPSKAYVSPRAVPKAALPAVEEAAKVLINLPAGESASVSTEADAVERERARDAKLTAQRRREPTVRIPRQTVDQARNAIAAREGRGAPAKITEAEIPVAAALEASATTEPTRSKAWIFALVGIAAAGGGAAFWFTSTSKPDATAPPTAAKADSPRAQATAPVTADPKPAAPPVELTAEPPATAPSVVTLNAAAADTPPAATTNPAPVNTPPPVNTWAAPPTFPQPGGQHPAASLPGKPKLPGKGFTPSSI
jgi:ribonuclease E